MEYLTNNHDIDAEFLRHISDDNKKNVVLVDKILNEAKEEAYKGNTCYIQYLNKDDSETDVNESIRILKEKGFYIELEKRKSNGSWYYYRMLIFW